MTRRVVAIVVALMLFVALPVFSSASAIVTDVLLLHTDMYAEMFDGNGNGRPTMTSDGSNYRKWDSPGLSTTSAKFVLYNRDSSPLFNLPSVSDFVIAFKIDSQRVNGGQISPVSVSYEVVLNAVSGTSTLTGSATPEDVIIGTDTAYYAFSFAPDVFPDLLTSDSVQKITFNFTFNRTAQGTAIMVYDILSQRAYDALIDGDGTPLAPDKNEDLDNAGEQMGNLENDALGGKTDEEIANDVNSALSFDVGTLDADAQAGISGFFDGLLVCFGADYQALMMLALSLGLAAFIIGRRYKTG